MKTNRYNLIDEDWIPIVGVGLVSLRRIFSDASLKRLGGSPIQKIALMKLFLAIAQRCATPQDDQAWEQMGCDGLAKACLAYLDEWHDAFYLYGERPFLQMPAVERAEVKAYAAINPEIANGNTSVLTQIMTPKKDVSDAQKALYLLTQMGFAFSGKAVDNSCVLSQGYIGKTKNGKVKPGGASGPSLGGRGFVHHFYLGENLHSSIYFNLFTKTDIDEQKQYNGFGTPPWEDMPHGEDCERANELKTSLIGRYIPLCRFCLLSAKGLHYTEGIMHFGYEESMMDPSCACDVSKKTVRMLMVNPTERPWRSLSALLSFLGQGIQRCNCLQLQVCCPRVLKSDSFSCWVGGVSVSSNSGEQFVSGSNDYVESTIYLPKSFLMTNAYTVFSQEMSALEKLNTNVYSSVRAYYEEFHLDKNQIGKFAAGAASMFWELAEKKVQHLIDACACDFDALPSLRKEYSKAALQAYDTACPANTARQIDAYIQHKPSFYKYINQTSK